MSQEDQSPVACTLALGLLYWVRERQAPEDFTQIPVLSKVAEMELTAIQARTLNLPTFVRMLDKTLRLMNLRVCVADEPGDTVGWTKVLAEITKYGKETPLLQLVPKEP
jgi:hypothetical protein